MRTARFQPSRPRRVPGSIASGGLTYSMSSSIRPTLDQVLAAVPSFVQAADDVDVVAQRKRSSSSGADQGGRAGAVLGR